MEDDEIDFAHFLTTSQVATTFKVDVSTVSAWVRTGHLTSARFGTGRTAPRVFNTDDVEAFGAALVELAGKAAA